MRKLKPEDCIITLECFPEEDDPARHFGDKRAVNWVLRWQERTEWAWCWVKVTAIWNGIAGEDSLGACAYKSEKDFKKGGYYEDMVNNAVDEVNRQLEKILLAAEALA